MAHEAARRSHLLLGLSLALAACGGGGGGSSDGGSSSGSSSTTAQTFVPQSPTGTVQGFVTDGFRRVPLPGVTVTVYVGNTMMMNPTAMTDDTGYFAVAGVPASAGILVTYSLDGYRAATQRVALQNSVGTSGVAQRNALTDASIALFPDQSVTITGNVYGAGAPVPSAQVLVRRTRDAAFVASGASDANGHFSLAGVPVDAESYAVDVLPIDLDTDGIDDFRYTSVPLGTRFGGGVDWSNVVVVLQAPSYNIVYTNLVQPSQLPLGHGSYSGGVLAVGAPVIVHFGSEVDRMSAALWILDASGNVVATPDDMAWVNDVLLSWTPAPALAADPDAGTRYRLRIKSLRFKDGIVFVDGADAGDQVDISFDVGSEAALPPNPEAHLYLRNLVCREDPHTAVAAVRGDASRIAFLDAAGVPCGAPGGDGTEWNSRTGIQLTWKQVPGAVRYRVFARNTVDAGGSSLQWTLVQEVSGFFPTFDEDVFAGGVDVFDGFGVFGGAPFEYGNHVQIAVTAVDVDGHESLLPPPAASIVDLRDETAPQLASIRYDAGEPDHGSAGIHANVTLSFNERMAASGTPRVTVASGMIVAASVRFTELSWGGVSRTPVNTATSLSLVDLAYDVRGACVGLRDVSTAGASGLSVTSNSKLQTGKAILLDASQAAAGEVDLVAPDPMTPNAVGLSAPLAADSPRNGLLCGYNPLAGDGTNITITVPANFADTVEVADATIFGIGMPVLVYKAGGTISVNVIDRLDTVAKFIGLRTPLTFAVTGAPAPDTRIIPLVGAEYVPRRPVAPLHLVRDVQAGANQLVTLSARPGPEMMIGDVVLIDDDGDLNTASDRELARIEGIVATSGSTDPRIGLSLMRPHTAATTAIWGLGDVLVVAGDLADTSGNGPLDPAHTAGFLGAAGDGFTFSAAP